MKHCHLLLGCALALFACGVQAADSKIDAALAQVSKLQNRNDFAGIASLLRPYADSKNATVEYYLAFASMNLAIGGHKTNEIKPADIQPAIDLAQRAAKHGSKEAWNLLFVLYGNGIGVPVDREKAVFYMKRGIAAGDQSAKANYAIQLYEGSVLVDRNVNASCVLIDELIADNSWMEVISYYAGVILFRGQCGKVANKAAGIDLIRAAADHGVREAERDMGKNHEFGWIGPVDEAQAFGWYRKASDHGDPEAQWRLGMAYVNGELGQPKDLGKARENFEGSAASGYQKAFTDLGSMYAMGEGMARNFIKAKEMYQKGAEAGDVRALHQLAIMYAQGEGVAMDVVAARKLYSDAIKQGLQRDAGLEKLLEAKTGRE